MELMTKFWFAGSSTLPRAQSVRSASGDDGVRGEKVAAATSSTSLYDNVQNKRGEQAYGSMRGQRGGGVGGNAPPTESKTPGAGGASGANHVAGGAQPTADATQQTSGGRQPPSGGNVQLGRRAKQLSDLKQQYYSDAETSRDDEFRHKRAKSKSTDDMTLANERNLSLDSNTLKRMLKPMPSVSLHKYFSKIREKWKTAFKVNWALALESQFFPLESH